VGTDLPQQNLLQRALRIALAYAFALQAIVAAYGLALAANPVGDARGLVICHNVGGETPDGPGKHVPGLPCALCTMAAQTGGLLPLPIAATAALGIAIEIVGPRKVAQTPERAPKHTGLARAPPRFV
jgi:hypothetical protein